MGRKWEAKSLEDGCDLAASAHRNYLDSLQPRCRILITSELLRVRRSQVII